MGKQLTEIKHNDSQGHEAKHSHKNTADSFRIKRETGKNTIIHEIKLKYTHHWVSVP